MNEQHQNFLSNQKENCFQHGKGFRKAELPNSEKTDNILNTLVSMILNKNCAEQNVSDLKHTNESSIHVQTRWKANILQKAKVLNFIPTSCGVNAESHCSKISRWRKKNLSWISRVAKLATFSYMLLVVFFISKIKGLTYYIDIYLLAIKYFIVPHLYSIKYKNC